MSSSIYYSLESALATLVQVQQDPEVQKLLNICKKDGVLKEFEGRSDLDVGMLTPPVDHHELSKDILEDVIQYLKETVISDDDPAYLIKFNMPCIEVFCNILNGAMNLYPNAPTCYLFPNYPMSALLLTNNFRATLAQVNPNLSPKSSQQDADYLLFSPSSWTEVITINSRLTEFACDWRTQYSLGRMNREDWLMSLMFFTSNSINSLEKFKLTMSGHLVSPFDT